MNVEFDQLINELHRKLQIAKEERKRSEMEAKLLQHRVAILQKQEKSERKRYENTKAKFEEILDSNRKNYDNSLTKIIKKNKIHNTKNKYNHIQSHYVLNKSQSTNDIKVLQKIRESNKVIKNPFIFQNNILYENELRQNKEEQKKKKEEEDRKVEIMEKKLRLKEELLKKIEEDEKQRKVLEDQLAKIEKKELSIINNFKGDNSYELIFEQALRKTSSPKKFRYDEEEI